MGFIQIRKGRAWHRIRTWTRVPSVAVTMCGKRAHGETVDTLPPWRPEYVVVCGNCERVAAKVAGASQATTSYR